MFNYPTVFATVETAFPDLFPFLHVCQRSEEGKQDPSRNISYAKLQACEGVTELSLLEKRIFSKTILIEFRVSAFNHVTHNLLSTCCVSGTVLGPGDAIMKEKLKNNSCFQGAYYLFPSIFVIAILPVAGT